MAMPFYAPGDSPGPNFMELLKRQDLLPFAGLDTPVPSELAAQITHGTTIVAMRFGDGVIMAGDRRATSGHLISHKTMEKVFAADRFSAVGIAGAAGPAVEMVRLFQLQIEHYEKVEGKQLSLDGKANQLSAMVRGHLPAAMQGMAVVPLFAGFDQRQNVGRLFQYDVTGGRYEEQQYATSGSGSLHAGTTLKLGFSDGLERSAAVSLILKALMIAADEDSATGGPDSLRGIYPVVASVTGEGYERFPDDELASLVDQINSEGQL